MTFRVEKKLFIKKENLLDFKEKISSIGAINLYKSRKVQSIYFDNINKDMYNDSIEGLNPRKKIRVRNYPDNINKYFFLEYKISSIEGRFKVNKKISHKRFDEFKLNGIFDKKYGEFLGAHMVGANVTELIAEVVAARRLETTGHEIIKTIHPHPTMSEAVMEAAAAAYGEVIHL